MAIYACSDIHGQYELFLKALETIHFRDEDTLYILGDVIDRGPESIPLLQDLMGRTNVTHLLGNHEFMMLRYLRGHEDGDAWMIPGNGGPVTFEAYKRLSVKEQILVRKYLRSLYLQTEVTIGGKVYLLSHSYYIRNAGTIRWKDASLPDVYRTVWESAWRWDSYIRPEWFSRDNREHVVGHVPVQMLVPSYWPGNILPEMPCYYQDIRNSVTNIDLGCAIIPHLQRANLPEQYQKLYGSACLCVLDLEKHADRAPDAAVYITP